MSDHFRDWLETTKLNGLSIIHQFNGLTDTPQSRATQRLAFRGHTICEKLIGHDWEPMIFWASNEAGASLKPVYRI